MNQAESKKEQKYIDTMVKLLDQGKFESAIEQGKNYIKEFPEQVFFYIGISLGYSESGDTDKGISFLEQAEKKFPDSYELLFQLGKMYEDKFNFTKAIKYLFKPPELRWSPERIRRLQRVSISNCKFQLTKTSEVFNHFQT